MFTLDNFEILKLYTIVGRIKKLYRNKDALSRY